MKHVRVLLADDHAMVLEGLSRIVGDRFTVAGTAGDGRRLCELAVSLQPDVIVTDVAMPRLNGIDAIRLFRAAGVRARVVVVTMYREPRLALDAMRAGAQAFVLKAEAAAELHEAIRTVMDGGTYISALVEQQVRQMLLREPSAASDRAARLTPRQREVVQLVAEGRSMKGVADDLGISRRTAETHKYDAMRALGVDSTPELAVAAVRLGIVSIRGPDGAIGDPA